MSDTTPPKECARSYSDCGSAFPSISVALVDRVRQRSSLIDATATPDAWAFRSAAASVAAGIRVENGTPHTGNLLQVLNASCLLTPPLLAQLPRLRAFPVETGRLLAPLFRARYARDAMQSCLEQIMSKGTVKWFNPTKGYGFIQPQGGGGKDVFVHISAVERAGLSSLSEGQVVEYEEVSNRGKTSAENLKVQR